MSSVRFIWRNIGVNKLRSLWTRGVNVSNTVRKYRREGRVRNVIICFRQTFFRPRRTLLFSATAAFKAKGGNEDKPPSCDQNIADEELEDLLLELDTVVELSQTLYCPKCNQRLVIEKKQPGIRYCMCKDPPSLSISKDGWEPYMEAEDVIIWRKEYKPGQGLYAYKVYGRYKEVVASQFAAVQVDSGYRRHWDAAVAALAVVEQSTTVKDQAVLHWEVLWPRLFANRDYVYIRRHKEFDVNTPPLNIFPDTVAPVSHTEERPSVHSNAKRKAQESYSRMGDRPPVENKVYIIISKSCEHPDVPETKHAIRVNEYWSNMVVRTIDGADNPGMEFVLTYYDEPAVGGLPAGVAAWATGRAAPAYLHKMRRAAATYHLRPRTDEPETMPSEPEKVSYEESKDVTRVSEEDMESSKQGPELENGETTTRDKSTQTETESPRDKSAVTRKDMAVGTDSKLAKDVKSDDSDEEQETNTKWWHYLHPFYYFV